MVESQRAPLANPPLSRRPLGAVGVMSLGAVLVLLYLLSRSNYLLFHGIIELFSIVVGFAIFVVAWNTRKLVSNDFVLFLGVAFLFVAVVDVFHTLAYQGMGVFPGFGANEPTQLWILARYIEAFSLLLAPLFLTRRLRLAPAAALYVLVAGFGLLSIVRLGIFPDCFVEGLGLTTFKIASEYVICLMLAGAVVLLSRHRSALEPRTFRLLVGAMVAAIAGEMAFTLYTDVYGVANMVGHLFKLMSFLLIYRAVVVASLATPFETLFREVSRSRDEARTYLDMAGTILLVLDREGKVRLINHRGAEVLGYAEEEILGRDWFSEFLLPDDRVREVFDALMTGNVQPSEYYENRVLTRDGSERLIAWHNTVLRDADGAISGTLGSGEDVTEQRRAEKMLRQSEERFRALFDRAPDAYYLSDLEGRFVDANAAAERLVGYRKDELMGKTFFESGLLSEEMAAQVAGLLALSVKGESTGADELTLTRKNGGQVVVEIRTELIESGGKTLVLGIAHDVTERKRAAEQVRLQRDYFMSLFSNSPEAIALLDVDYRITDVNAAFFSLFGYDRDAALGKKIDALIVPEGRKHEALGLERQGKSGQSGTVTDTVRCRRDGSLVAVSISDAPIVSAGRTVGVFAMYQDITERKRSEDEVRASEEKFRALFEQSIDAIYINALDGTSVEANQSWLDMFGYTRDELPFIDSARDVYVDPRDRDDFLRRINSIGVVADEVRFKKKDGTVMHCQRTVVARRDASGAVVAFQGIIRDVTERERNAEALHRSEKQYRSLFEQSRDAILLTAPDGRLLDANPAFLELFGYAPDDLAGLRMPDLLVDGLGSREFAARLQRDGGIVDDECRFRKKDGTVMDCIRTIVVWRNEAGEVVAHQGLIRDITERKRAEQEILGNEARLRSLVNVLQNEAASAQELLDYALGEAITLTGSRIGYIYFYDEGRKEFTLNTWSREVMKECTIQEPQTVYQLDKTGIWGEAVRQRGPIVVNEFDAPNPLKKGYPEGHATLQRYATVPVFSAGHIVAVVGVANKETDYSATDVLQLTLLMDSVWKAVERIKVSEQISRFTQRLEHAMSAGSLAWWQMALPSGEVVFDERKATMLGYAQSDFSHYSDFTALLHAEDAQKAMQAMRDHLEGKAERYEVEYRIRTFSGDYRWFRDVGGVTERDSEGKPSLVTGIVVDITGLKSAEERLAESNRELRDLAAMVDTAREEERAAVAWELHDEVAQALSVVKMDISSCASRLPAESQRQVGPTMEQIVGLLDSTIVRLRRLYTNLVPVMLEDLGLAAAVEWHVEQFGAQTGAQVRVGRLENLKLRDDRTTLGLFRVFQDALAHTSSHPGATSVTVDLEGEDGYAVLRISDDGHGFADCESETSCAVVLTSIRERARSWGGSATVSSSSGRGTVLKVTAPLAVE